MLVTILGKRWKVCFVSMKDYGECDPASKPRKEIRIRKDLKGEALLDTLLHEAAHAADQSKDEEWVNEMASDIARMLWRLGYRREGE